MESHSSKLFLGTCRHRSSAFWWRASRPAALRRVPGNRRLPTRNCGLRAIEIEKLYQHFAKGQAQNTGTVTKIKFADPDRALELLGRYLKMFVGKVELTGAEQLVARLQAARMRTASDHEANQRA